MCPPWAASTSSSRRHWTLSIFYFNCFYLLVPVNPVYGRQSGIKKNEWMNDGAPHSHAARGSVFFPQKIKRCSDNSMFRPIFIENSVRWKRLSERRLLNERNIRSVWLSETLMNGVVEWNSCLQLMADTLNILFKTLYNLSNKRLCYCRGTARRATLVEILWPFFDWAIDKKLC